MPTTKADQIQAAVDRCLADAPPLNARQVRVLSGLLRSGGDSPRPHYEAPEPKPETPEERDKRLGDELTKRLSVCASCGIEQARHTYPEYYGYISHSHRPLSLRERLRVTEKFLEETAE
ncbi:hypothetical protein PBI_SUPERFRESH_54 [Microbacterium phage Superfresh]|uniref:Uncharacterized protein n=5 Tax=Ilzatvirus teagan TaxID=2845595 RepID=A0A6B9M1M1_9CAUD|nr:hypothetical protein PBI_PEEP_54 [Microbacterium phage Peep]AUX83330.1 hypothetical protein PBI_SUPERFRESH_54 [Microbacterium phage Superfresh]AVR56256.1 hypothetical protein PBI_DAVE_54 [Microbacterium phage Dave]AVR56659.1 hypothetical protein PBI_ANTOINETTE_54 [Microbacterium phage Antoinette]QHB47856.1 hypothetical protein SEA_RENZIE_54 [Microbacterium phage Renzie]